MGSVQFFQMCACSSDRVKCFIINNSSLKIEFDKVGELLEKLCVEHGLDAARVGKVKTLKIVTSLSYQLCLNVPGGS